MSRRLNTFKIQAENIYSVETDVKEDIALLFIMFSSLYESLSNKNSCLKNRIKMILGFNFDLIIKKSWS